MSEPPNAEGHWLFGPGLSVRSAIRGSSAADVARTIADDRFGTAAEDVLDERLPIR